MMRKEAYLTYAPEEYLSMIHSNTISKRIKDELQLLAEAIPILTSFPSKTLVIEINIGMEIIHEICTITYQELFEVVRG